MAGQRILIVDDEQEIVDLLTETLSSRGFAVDSAMDAAGALDLVRANIYDAAILDFNLPDLNGVMLHRQLRQMDEELAGRTLFTSGLLQNASDMDYYSAYGAGFLAKPFSQFEVIDALRRTLAASPEESED